jgi:hypothetical protein
MADQNKKTEPTFIDQAFAIIENTYSDNGSDHGMTIMDHKLLVRILDAHEKCIDEKNEEFRGKLIGDVNEVIGKQWIRVLDEKLLAQSKQLNAVMERIASDLNDVKGQLNTIDDRVSAEERRLNTLEAWQGKAEEWAERKKKRIEILEDRVDVLDPNSKFTSEILEMKPYIMKWGRFLEWWSWKNWWKIVLVVIAITIIFIGVNIFMHDTGMVTLWDKQSNVDKIEMDIKTGHVDPRVRDIKQYEMTDEERTRKQDNIAEDIKRRTDEYEKKYGHKLVTK